MNIVYFTFLFLVRFLIFLLLGLHACCDVILCVCWYVPYSEVFELLYSLLQYHPGPYMCVAL